MTPVHWVLTDYFSSSFQGHYTGNVEVTDQSGNELACINLDVHL